MKKWALLCGAVLLFAGIASAQDKAEIFGGYSYLRASSGVFGTGNGYGFNGGSGSFAFNVLPGVGIVADLGGYRFSGGTGLPGEQGTVITYMFGLKVSHHAGPVTPFVQSLFGGARLTGDVLCGPVSCPGSQTSFAMALGGGLDWNLTPHVGLRVIQAEYLLTQFNIPGVSTSSQQNNFRVSAGVVFRF
jgi:opacity protein-like surface antigen